MPVNYRSGLGSVGSYQVSGVPYITGSGENGLPAVGEHKIEFPSVAKSVLVINTDPVGTTAAVLRVHFVPRDAGNVYSNFHYATLNERTDAMTFNVKCKEIYISTASGTPGSYEVIAELTGIAPTEMFSLTGSGLTE